MKLPKWLFASPVILIWLTWGAIVVPRLAQSLTSPKHRTTVRSEGEGYSAVAALADVGMRYALFGYCLVVIVTVLLNRGYRFTPTIFLFLGPWLVLVLRGLYLGAVPHTNAFLYPMLGVAIWVLRPRLEHLRHLGYATGVTAVLALGLGIALPAAGIYRAIGGELISPDKQILPWGILVGPFTSGNNLAQFLVLGLPTVFLIARQRTRFTLIVAVALAILWTSSRSSLIALVVALVVAGLLSVRTDLLRSALAAGSMTVLGIVAVGLPLVTTDPLAFTNRGYIWDVSLRQWELDPWFGHGSGWYGMIARYQTELGSTAFHAHNEAVQALVTGGLVMAGALAALVLFLVARSTLDAARSITMPALFVSVLLVTCWFEVSLAIVDRVLLLPVTALPMAFIVFKARPASEHTQPTPTTRNALERSSS